MDATTDTDTNIYIAHGRPVTRAQWVESIAADWLAVSGDHDIIEVARLLRTWPAADLAAQCAAGWADEEDGPTVAELTAALAGLRDMYAAAEAAAH